MIEHVIVHQFDPAQPVAGGIDGFIRDFVRYAPAEIEFSIVGVDAAGTHEELGEWKLAPLGGRSVRFMPVARLDPGNQRRVVPHGLRLILGLIRYRPRIGRVVVHTQRAEIGAAVAVLYRRAWRLQVLQGDAAAGFGAGTDTLWRFAPKLYHALERFAVIRSQRTVIMSGSAFERLRPLSDGVTLGTNWFDGDIFRWSGGRDGSSPRRIGWAGRLEPPKDPLRAVRVFDALKRRGLAFRGWIAGSGTIADDVAAAIRGAGLSEDVDLLGLLTPHELADELRRTDVLLMTSLFEGVPRGALEALGCGVPVVAPRVGELGSLVANGVNGFLSSDGDEDDLADLVVRALSIGRGRDIAETVAHLEARRVVGDLFAALPSDE